MYTRSTAQSLKCQGSNTFQALLLSLANSYFFYWFCWWKLVLKFTQVHDIWWKTLIYISIAAIRLIFANCLGMHLPFDFDLPLPLGPNVRVLFSRRCFIYRSILAPLSRWVERASSFSAAVLQFSRFWVDFQLGCEAYLAYLLRCDKETPEACSV